MTKSKIFIAAGSTVLAVAGFMASHATKKFVGVATAYFKGSSNLSKVHVASGYFTGNSVGVGHTAFFYTAGSLKVTLVTTLGKNAYYL